MRGTSEDTSTVGFNTRYLNHLPENHEVTFIEINMKGLLN